jgi:hypothetical protein
MKFVLECDVQSETILPKTLRINVPGRVFELLIGGNNFFNKIRIAADVQDTSKFTWGLEPLPQPADSMKEPSAKVNAIYDVDLYKSIISDLQCLESTLGVMFGVKKIGWESPSISVVFERESEQHNGWDNIGSIRMNRPKIDPMRPDPQVFASLAMLSFNYKPIVVTQAFWRQGEVDLLRGDFISAFFNFYFVLEGLYGNGKTKNRQVIEEFNRSSKLRQVIDSSLKKPTLVRYIQQVTAMLEGRKFTKDREGLIELLVRTRGDLHHFANNPYKPEGSPFSNYRYEGIAVLSREFSLHGLLLQMLESNDKAHKGVHPNISAEYI